MGIKAYDNGVIVSYADAKGNSKAPEAGNFKKTYRLKASTTWKIASSAIKQWENKKHNIIFVTLTFPKPEGRKLLTHTQSNQALGIFLDNWKKTYKLKSYVWVAEKHKKDGIHYHIIAEYPKTNIQKLNNAWCSAYSHFDLPHSACALRLPKDGSVVKSLRSVVKYLCKYISKEKDSRYSARCYGISRNVLAKPKEIGRDSLDLIEANIETYEVKLEHCSIIYLKDYLDNPYALQLIREAPDISIKTSEYDQEYGDLKANFLSQF